MSLSRTPENILITLPSSNITELDQVFNFTDTLWNNNVTDTLVEVLGKNLIPSTNNTNTTSNPIHQHSFHLTGICELLTANRTDSSLLRASCPVNSFGQAKCEGWLAFISQLGFNNGHALLALFGLCFAFVNHFRVISKYKRYTKNADFTSLTEFQRFHIIFHYFLMAGCSTFLAGMLSHVYNIKPAWIILAAVTEVIFFGLQLLLMATTIRSWIFQNKRQCGYISVLFLLFYFVPSLIYVITISLLSSIVVGGYSVPDNIGYLAQTLFILLHCIRGVPSIAYLIISTGPRRHLDASNTEKRLRWTNIYISAISLVYGILSISFTLDFFCPSFGGLWIRYVEWYYLLLLYLSITYGFFLEFNDTKIITAPEPESLKDTEQSRNYGLYPGRQQILSGRNVSNSSTPPAPLLPQTSNTTVVGDIESNPLTTNELPSSKLPYELVGFQLNLRFDIACFVLSILCLAGIIALHLCDIYLFRNAKKGVSTVIIVSYSLFTFFQIGFGIFNRELPEKHAFKRSALALGLISGFGITFITLPEHQFYVAYGLIPLMVLLWGASSPVYKKSGMEELIFSFKSQKSAAQIFDETHITNNQKKSNYPFKLFGTRQQRLPSSAPKTNARAAQSWAATKGTQVKSRTWGSVSARNFDTLTRLPPAILSSLRFICAGHVLFTVGVAMVSGFYAPLAIAACLICFCLFLDLKRSIFTWSGQVLFWSSSLVFTLILLILTQLPLLILSSNSLQNSSVGIFGLVSSPSQLPFPASDVTLFGGVGSYVYLKAISDQPTGDQMMEKIKKSGGYLIGEIGNGLMQSLKPLQNVSTTFGLLMTSIYNPIKQPLYFTMSDIGNLDQFTRFSNYSSLNLGIHHGLGSQAAVDLSLSPKNNPYSIDVIDSEMLLLNPFLPISLSSRQRKQLVLISKYQETAYNATFPSSVLSQAILYVGKKLGVFAYAMTDYHVGIQTMGRWTSRNNSTFWYTNGNETDENNWAFSSKPARFELLQNSTTGLDDGVSTMDTSKLVAAALPLSLVTFLVFLILLAYEKWESFKKQKREDIAKKDYDDNDSQLSDSKSFVSKTSTEIENEDLRKRSLALLMDETTSLKWGVAMVEVISLVGWFIFVVATGNNKNTGRLEFLYAFAVLGATSCLLTIGGGILEKFHRLKTLYVFQIVLNSLSVISSGYAAHFIVSDPVPITSQSVNARLMLIGTVLFAGGKTLAAWLLNYKFSRTKADQEKYVGFLNLLLSFSWILGLFGIVRLKLDYTDYPLSPFIPLFIAGSMASCLLIGFSLFRNQRAVNGGSAAFIVASLYFAGCLLSESRSLLVACTPIDNMRMIACAYQWKVLLSASIVYCIFGTVVHASKFWYFETVEQSLLRLEIYAQMLKEKDRAKALAEREDMLGPLSFGLYSREPVLYIALSRNTRLWTFWRASMGLTVLCWTVYISGVGSLKTNTLLYTLIPGVVGSILNAVSLSFTALAVTKDSRTWMLWAIMTQTIALMFNGSFITQSCQYLIDLQNTSNQTEGALVFAIIGAVGVSLFTILLSSIALYRHHLRSIHPALRQRNFLFHQGLWLPFILLSVAAGMVFNDAYTSSSFTMAADRLSFVSGLVTLIMGILFSIVRYAYFMGEMTWTFVLPTTFLQLSAFFLGHILLRSIMGLSICPLCMQSSFIVAIVGVAFFIVIVFLSHIHYYANSHDLNPDHLSPEQEEERDSRWTFTGPEHLRIVNWIQGRDTTVQSKRYTVFQLSSALYGVGWIIFVVSQGIASKWTANGQIYAAAGALSALLNLSVFAHWIGVYIAGTCAAFIGLLLSGTILIENLAVDPYYTGNVRPNPTPARIASIVGAFMYAFGIFSCLCMYYLNDYRRPLPKKEKKHKILIGALLFGIELGCALIVIGIATSPPELALNLSLMLVFAYISAGLINLTILFMVVSYVFSRKRYLIPLRMTTLVIQLVTFMSLGILLVRSIALSHIQGTRNGTFVAGCLFSIIGMMSYWVFVLMNDSSDFLPDTNSDSEEEDKPEKARKGKSARWRTLFRQARKKSESDEPKKKTKSKKPNVKATKKAKTDSEEDEDESKEPKETNEDSRKKTTKSKKSSAAEVKKSGSESEEGTESESKQPKESQKEAEKKQIKSKNMKAKTPKNRESDSEEISDSDSKQPEEDAPKKKKKALKKDAAGSDSEESDDDTKEKPTKKKSPFKMNLNLSSKIKKSFSGLRRDTQNTKSKKSKKSKKSDSGSTSEAEGTKTRKLQKMKGKPPKKEQIIKDAVETIKRLNSKTSLENLDSDKSSDQEQDIESQKLDKAPRLQKMKRAFEGYASTRPSPTAKTLNVPRPKSSDSTSSGSVSTPPLPRAQATKSTANQKKWIKTMREPKMDVKEVNQDDIIVLDEDDM